MYAANKAAVQMKRENWKEAIRDCSEALSLDPAYVKALLRRAAGYEKIDDLEHSLQDYEKVGCRCAAQAARLDCSLFV